MSPEPRATYRLQLRAEFDLDRAAAVVPYLASLGVSHIYLSPYLQSARGSTHGYDVVDPTRVNVELGGDAAQRRLCDALGRAGLRQMLDIVPNHMAIKGDQNPWWWDVLEDGPASRYAMFFDVDWEASEERWPNKVLLPVLGDHYGRVLEAGELRLHHEDGVFTLHYGEQAFPLDTASLGGLLAVAAQAAASEMLGFLAESCARLPRPTVADRRLVERRHRDKGVIQQLLTRLCRDEPNASAAIDAEVARLNADADALDGLIDAQNYRLALWRTAGRDLGYRRFFDINDLAGLRVEDEAVFHAVHGLPLAWLRDGSVHGLRIDHVDGLRDPMQYFGRLRSVGSDAWIVVEKILHREECIPPDWPVAGTTGYEFLNRTTRLFIDPSAEQPLTDLVSELTGDHTAFADVAYESKRQVLKELLGSELNRLVSLFVGICESHRRHRDYTRQELYQVLLEVAACFPVYRTYVRAPEGIVADSDRRHVETAIEAAIARRPELDPELFRFFEDILLVRRVGVFEAELTMRFQQLTGPAMAKGVEDTAFYRHHRLVCLNEVGGDPETFSVTPAEFHAACREAQTHHPHGLLASATHDTKRGEDVRARLAILSEIPQVWADTVRGWIRHNDQYRCDAGPDRCAEYLLYQTLVGAWPVEAPRLHAYMEKAAREAKTHTSWTQPSQDYEDALRRFIDAVLADEVFLASLEAFVQPLVQPGRVNSLAQTLLKLTSPGVPDVYQGTELWDLSLVDPDNRRPVDFARRTALLAEVDRLSVAEIVERMDEGLPKLWVVRQALQLRRRRPDAFGTAGTYEPLAITGARAKHAIGFSRGTMVAIVVPRLVLGLADGWEDTTCVLAPGEWRNELTGERYTGGAVRLSQILGLFPVALLSREENA